MTYGPALESFRETALVIRLEENVLAQVDTLDVYAPNEPLVADPMEASIYSVNASFCGDSDVDALALSPGDEVRICLKVNEYPHGFLESCRDLEFIDTKRQTIQPILDETGGILPGMQSMVSLMEPDAICAQKECLSYNVAMFQLFSLSVFEPTVVTLQGTCLVSVGDGLERRHLFLRGGARRVG
eukprot:CAMPEP_0172448532 /NCGR_PEP_ID=MMETSP1065-20121228/7542_1 /TAXON_ID=265537 /ORGANISM="Amphiprora paludosa, Strain CCMP125" /LENGTH=184 /DNA_ID=CAMNT_0013200073 /DNA_START=50 /DNA_END=600 /DNA_ORIENTATION=-